MEDAKSIDTPIDVNAKLFKNGEEDEESRNRPYRELIGALMYLGVATRPDILRTVVGLAQFSNNYRQSHWIAAKRVLRYLKGTSNTELTYQKSDLSLTGYTDWGYAFIMSGAAVTWKSQKQRTVALSSTEAEYMAITEATKEAMYLSTYLQELGFMYEISLFRDNQGARLLANNQVYHSRTKHIDMRYHFVRDVLKDNKFRLTR